MTLAAGDQAPEFDLPTDGGGRVRLADLKGRPLVLYFYPKDDTPGCTKEAQGFAEAHAGVRRGRHRGGRRLEGRASPATTGSRPSTACPSCSPPTRPAAVVEAYGSWVEKSMYGKSYMGIDRSTFLIDGSGTVRKVWRKVKVPGHVDEVLAAARALARPHEPAHAAARARRSTIISWRIAARASGGTPRCAPRPRGLPEAGMQTAPEQASADRPADRADRRAPRARDRLLHRLRHARDGAGAAAGWPGPDPRRQRRTGPRSAASAWRAAGVEDKIETRFGLALDSLDRLLAEGAAEQLRSDPDRRRQEELRRLLRAQPQARAAGRPDPARQRAVGRRSSPIRPTATARPVALRALNAKLHADPRISLALVPIGDGLTIGAASAAPA